MAPLPASKTGSPGDGPSARGPTRATALPGARPAAAAPAAPPRSATACWPRQPGGMAQVLAYQQPHRAPQQRQGQQRAVFTNSFHALATGREDLEFQGRQRIYRRNKRDGTLPQQYFPFPWPFRRAAPQEPAGLPSHQITARPACCRHSSRHRCSPTCAVCLPAGPARSGS